jgi:ABC-type bacteriocin/lantibiotic exporter with double-glycine peptidase domain
MLLRYHRRPVTFDEVRQAIYKDRTGVPNAAHVVEAAERFRLHVRGLAVEDPMLLESIPTPNIALVM